MDEQLYSRQLYVLGREAQERLQSCKVLVSGELNGLGVEIAKNVMLAGVHSLTICDDSPCKVVDLSSNFYINEDHVKSKTPRSAAVFNSLRELNRHVNLDLCGAASLTLDDEGYGKYNVVVVVNGEKSLLQRVDEFCHHHEPNPIMFCSTGSYGLYGYVFNDFGPEFTVVDVDGEIAKQGIVLGIEKSGASRLVISTADDKHHGLKDKDWVRFEGVKGLASLNNGEPRQIESVKMHNSDGHLVEGLAFSIPLDKAAEQEEYISGGHFEQVKIPKRVSFKTLTNTLEDPPCVVNNWMDPDMPFKLHAYLLGIWKFTEERDRLPVPGSEDDADTMTSDIKVQSSKELFKTLAKGAAGQLNPMAAYLGGIAAQEVLKACSGKFTPINQYFHFAAPECLPKTPPPPSSFPSLKELTGHNLTNANSRYTGQAAVFGWDFQDKLAKLKVFLVGAGALGCENLKNLALMGVSLAPAGGELLVTDMDGIEISNLNRQFLFLPQHVGKMKSVVAAEVIKAMNASLNVRALQTKVAPDTEDTFDDLFWSKLDVVINALDNVTARRYVDSKCVFHQKPLLESGTLGTKANTLPVVPHLTESYGSDPVQDKGGDDIPACTLHAYPNLIEHTLAWARDAVFEKYFNLDITEGQEYLKHSMANTLDKYMKELDCQPSTKLTRLRTARSVLVRIVPSDHVEKLFPYEVSLSGSINPDMCVRLARLRFEELFCNKIKQLLHVHPKDKVVDDKGTLFWAGKRRVPKEEVFEWQDPLHELFVTSCASLYAQVYNVGGFPVDPKQRSAFVRGILSKQSPLGEFVVDDTIVVPENDEQAKALKEAQEKQMEKEAESVAVKCEEEMKLLLSNELIVVKPQQFEKDDDTNGHMDLIYSAACIRARSYGIPIVDKLKGKMIVGRIIPAIATTTAMTTGAIMLELYKLIHNHPIDLFRCSNINLAVNSYASFEPTPCQKRFFGKKKYIKAQNEDKVLPVSLWSMVNLHGDLTVQEIMDYFLDKYEFEIMQISTKGDVVLFNDMFGQDDRLELKISSLYKTVTNTDPPHYIIVNIDGDYTEDSDEDDDEEEEDEEDDFVIPACRIDWSS